ncbi:MAG: radical SAM protein [Deltaproteobacteria bacterium]|nr:radical SAM protein [Deltaproteobacteria bacterium]
MKITFIRPNIGDRPSLDAMTPLVFAYLSAMTPIDVDRVLYDDRIESIPFDEPTDLVAITVETYTARRAYWIANQFRLRGVPVVMGGYHPTFMPHEALRYADSVAIGDAEGIWNEILNDFKNNELKPVYRQNALRPLKYIKPDRSIFSGKRYAPIPLVQYARGCKYACEFCSISAFYGKNLRQRNISEVIEEIETLNRKHIFIVDDNIFVDERKAELFFEALIPLKIKWSSQVSIDVALNPKLLNLMKKSGCLSVVVGFESLSFKNLAQMKKGWNLKQNYETAIERLRDIGVMIYGTFVHGYDNDTKDTFEETVNFAIKNKFFLANFNPLTPTPGAKLYTRLKKEGKLLNDPWWLDPNYAYGKATFTPKGMTPTELEEGCFWARKEFNKFQNIVYRSNDFKANMGSPYSSLVFWGANLVSKYEILRKQGSPLGIAQSEIPVLKTDFNFNKPIFDTTGKIVKNVEEGDPPIYGYGVGEV